jgi:hypothetical protein
MSVPASHTKVAAYLASPRGASSCVLLWCKIHSSERLTRTLSTTVVEWAADSSSDCCMLCGQASDPRLRSCAAKARVACRVGGCSIDGTTAGHVDEMDA